jgi:hypothetical protein
LIDWLDYNGFTVITKPAKEFEDGDGCQKFKRNMRVELAVDAMELAEHVDRIVLFSGYGDFCPLVEAMQRRGVHVTVVSTMKSHPPMIADELRRQADVFTDLAAGHWPTVGTPLASQMQSPTRWLPLLLAAGPQLIYSLSGRHLLIRRAGEFIRNQFSSPAAAERDVFNLERPRAPQTV